MSKECLKCKTKNENDSLYCIDCGNALQSISNSGNKVLGATYIGVGILCLIGGFTAFRVIIDAANRMKEITSVSGTSIAEAYYQSMGYVAYGIGQGVAILAILTCMICCYLGRNILKG